MRDSLLQCGRLVISLCFSLFLAGCQPNEAALQATATHIAAGIFATLTAQVPTPTPTPVPTRTPSPTPTPRFDALVKVSLLKAFSGPEMESSAVYEFTLQDELVITGRDRDCSWVQVTTPFGDQAWINTQLGRVELVTPCASLPHGFSRPENGAVIFDQRDSVGHGELKVDNQLLVDGYVVLAESASRPLVGSYIRSASQIIMTGIPDGKYWVFFSTGQEWDLVDLGFVKNVRYQKMQEPIEFTTTHDTYSTWRVTLHPVEGGQVQTETLQADDFPVPEP